LLESDSRCSRFRDKPTMNDLSSVRLRRGNSSMITGFFCLKNALIALNSFYLMLGCILISLGAYNNAAGIVPSLSVNGGVTTVGVFLLLVAILGIYGTVKHHQVALFFYMILLSFIFLIQIFVAVACLALNENSVHDAAKIGWTAASSETRCYAEKKLNCCGFESKEADTECESWSCENKDPCWPIIRSALVEAMQSAGGVGLFFSFTEIAGIWFALRYRNMVNPMRDTHVLFN
ncbi:Tetraspanin-31, partial [Trichinella nativa]